MPPTVRPSRHRSLNMAPGVLEPPGRCYTPRVPRVASKAQEHCAPTSELTRHDDFHDVAGDDDGAFVFPAAREGGRTRPTCPLDLPVLVVNRFFQPVQVTSARRAFLLLYGGAALAVDESGEDRKSVV